MKKYTRKLIDKLHDQGNAYGMSFSYEDYKAYVLKITPSSKRRYNKLKRICDKSYIKEGVIYEYSSFFRTTNYSKQPHHNLSHTHRASRLERLSDTDLRKYYEVSMLYFNGCALSGEQLTRGNSSVDHLVALRYSGDNILENLIPVKNDYNRQKSSHYLLEYWDSQKNSDGNSIYSPFRLLNIVIM